MGKEEKKVAKQQEILKAFYLTVQSHGFENASMARIAEILDIRPSLILHYFSSKESMVVAMVDSIIQQYQGDFLPLIRNIQDPKERLRKLVFGIFSLEWISKVDNGVFYSFYACGFQNQEIKNKFQVMYETFKTILVEELQMGLDEGVINENINPDLFADFLISIQEGNTYYQGLMRGKIRGKVTADHHMEQIYFLLGI